MSKKVTASKPGAEKALTIIVTVLPPKKGLRTMIVSAAREGEMPLVLGGPFSERHALMDAAYAQVLRREPQVVTVKETATSSSPKKAKKAKKAGAPDDAEDGDGDEAEEGKTEESAQDSTDQLVEPSPNPLPAEEEELPAIEGDEADPAAEDVSKFEAQLHEKAVSISDISSPAESGAEVHDAE